MSDKTIDQSTADERFERRLVEMHEALAAGGTSLAPSMVDDTDAELEQALEPAHDVLKMIERVRRQEQGKPAGDETVSFVDNSRQSIQATTDPGTSTAERLPAAGAHLPERLGRFEVVRLLGQGGGGVVLLANDPDLKRPVALKVPRPEALMTAEVRSRFLRESEAAAALNHSHIVPVYEVGSDGPLSYIVSAYCDGTSLAEWLKQHAQPLEPRIAAELTATLADAVQHAHSRGILHRDLKPANVLLEGTDARRPDWQSDQAMDKELDELTIRPTSDAQPLAPGELARAARISDFGLARIEGTDGQTQTGSILGTPSYMSPEQAEGDIRHVGPPADIYSLGAILYELLTGRPPFREGSILETLQAVRQNEPTTPRRLRADVPRNVEAICLKCLEKSPERRYASAAELAEDLRRHLRNMPVVARSVGSFERGAKWVRRHAVVSALLAVVAVSVIAGTTASTVFGIRAHRRAISESEAKGLALQREREANEARDAAVEAQQAEATERLRADRGEQEALWNLYVSRLFAMQTAWEQRNFGRLERLLEESVPAADAPDFRGWEWYYFQDQCRQASQVLETRSPTGRSVAWSKTSGRMAIVLADGSIEIRDRAGHSIERHLPVGAAHARVNWHPDGEQLIVRYGNRVDTWNARTAERVREFVEPNVGIYARAWAPVTDRVALATTTPEFVIREAETRQLVRKIELALSPQLSLSAWALDWHPDGVRLAAAARVGHCVIADVSTGEWSVRLHPRESGAPMHAVAWSPDGTLVAVSSPDGTFLVDERNELIAGCEELLQFNAHSLDWNGRQLLLGCADHSLVVWDHDAKRIARVMHLYDQPVLSAAWGPNARRILSCADEARLIDLDRLDEAAQVITTGLEKTYKVAWSPDGHRIAVGGGPNGANLVLIYDAETAELVHRLTHASRYGIRSVAWSPRGDRLVSLTYDHKSTVWNSETGQPVDEFQPEVLGLGGNADVAWSPEDRYVAITNHQGTVSFYDPQSRQKKLAIRNDPLCWFVRWNSDGRFLAATHVTGLILWDVHEQRLVYHAPRERNNRLCWSPDDRLIATSSGNGEVVFGRARDGEVVHRSAGHTGSCEEVAWAPDGRRIATCSLDRTVRIWDAATGTELVRLPCGDNPASLAWSADGRRLACALRDQTVQIWGSVDIDSIPVADELPWGVLAGVPPFDEQPESTYERLPLDREFLFRSEAIAIVEQSLDESTDEAEKRKHLSVAAADDELYAELVKRRPHDSQLPVAKALHLASLERWDEAAQQLDQAHSIADDETQIDVARGDLYAQREMWTEAVESYSRTLSPESENAPVFAKRAAAQVRLEQFPSAIADYSRACELDPLNQDYPANRAKIPLEVYQRGSQRRRANDFPEAIARYRQAAELYNDVYRGSPDDRPLQLQLARVQLEIGSLLPQAGGTVEERIEVLDAARTMLQSLVAAEPKVAIYRHELGRATSMLTGLYWSSNPEQAENLYRQTIEHFKQALSLYAEGEKTLGTRSSLRFTHWGHMQFLARGRPTGERAAQAIEAGLKAVVLEDDRMNNPPLDPAMAHRDRLEALLREAGRTAEADAVKQRTDELPKAAEDGRD